MNSTPRLEEAWIGIDLGTQSVRAMAVSGAGAVLASASHSLVSVRSGFHHTQNAESWWQAVCVCCRQIARSVPREIMRALAVDSTSGTILLTDEALRPASEALMYDDGRAADEAREAQAAGEALWRELGYRIQPSWALPKLLWLWRSSAEAASAALVLTHQNDFIHQRLAGCRLACDWSHSLKTGYDLVGRRWPFEIFAALGLPERVFPPVVAPATVIGAVSEYAASQTSLPAGLPIVSGMTDGCAAQISSGAIRAGSWNSVLGTTLVLKGVTRERLHDPLGVVYSHLSPEGRWLPGGASSTGAGLIARRFPGADLDRLTAAAARRGPSSVMTYPLPSKGERFPFLAPQASGFTIGSPEDEEDAYRSILEGVAFLERLAFDSMELLGAGSAGPISITGGAVRNDFWNRLRASILGRRLIVAANRESAFGMAVLAASHDSSLEEAAARMIARGRTIEPEEDFASRYAASYRKLISELEARGWLPHSLASFSLARAGAPEVSA